MKKYIVLAIFLVAGLVAITQAVKTDRGTKSEKGKTKSESVRQSASKSQQQSKRTATQVRTQNENQSGTRAVVQSRTRVETDNNQQRNVKASDNNRSGLEQRGETKTRETPSRTKTEAASTRVQRPTDPVEVRVKNTGATRVYRESKGTLTRDDGTVLSHQNDEIFKSNKYNVNYGDYGDLRRSEEFRRGYSDYNAWYEYRTVRNISPNSRYRPVSIDIRRERYVYRQPMHYDLIWTPYLFNRFMYYYPANTYWDIEYGNEIETISSYDVIYYVGAVKRVYGKVEEVYYSRQDNNYVLYMGDRFPYQDLSIVIPRHIALRITNNPDMYFHQEYIWLIGLIELWEDKPEIVIRDEEQIQRY